NADLVGGRIDHVRILGPRHCAVEGTTKGAGRSRDRSWLKSRGRGASRRRIRSVLSIFVLLTGLGASASPLPAAEQIVLGRSFVVKDSAPGRDATLRSVVIVGKEPGSTDTIVGDPVTSGATVEIIANGARSTDQLFTLPAGAAVNGAAGWM